MKRISATDFKAKCPTLLDEVARTGESIEVHKRGKAVACVVAAPGYEGASPPESLRGTVTVFGDIIAPVFPPEAWQVVRYADGRRL